MDELKWKGTEVAQLCPTLCDPMNCSLTGSSLHWILQARILEWVAISFSRGSSWHRDQTQVPRIAGRRFNSWATREAKLNYKLSIKNIWNELQICPSNLTRELEYDGNKKVSTREVKNRNIHKERDVTYFCSSQNITKNTLIIFCSKISLYWQLCNPLELKSFAC